MRRSQPRARARTTSSRQEDCHDRWRQNCAKRDYLGRRDPRQFCNNAQRSIRHSDQIARATQAATSCQFLCPRADLAESKRSFRTRWTRSPPVIDRLPGHQHIVPSGICTTQELVTFPTNRHSFPLIAWGRRVNLRGGVGGVCALLWGQLTKARRVFERPTAAQCFWCCISYQ